MDEARSTKEIPAKRWLLGPSRLLFALTLVSGTALASGVQASDGLQALERPWSWADWTGEQRSPVYLQGTPTETADLPDVDVPAPTEPAPAGSEPAQPVPDAAAEESGTPPRQAEPETRPEVVEPGPDPAPAPEPLLIAPAEPATVPAPEAAPEPIEAAAPSPWAELDLTLYDRCVAPIPPGIPEARAVSRRTKRDAARAELAEALAGPTAELWRTWLSDRLRYAQDEPAAWRGLAEVVVEQELFGLAGDLATGLEADPGQLVHQVARLSLAELYGREFATPAELAAYTEGLQLSPSTLRILAELRDARAAARGRLLELFEHDRALALAHLGDNDPRVRVGAAEVLAAELAAAGAESSEEILPPLLDRLAVERWPDVAAVLLDTAGDALVGRPAGDPLVERLRGGLADASVGGAVGAELLVATNLARLPWTGTEAGAPDSLERGADVLAALLGRVLPDGGAGAPGDLDVTLGLLRSIEDMLPGTGGTEDDRATAERLAASDLSAPLRALLANPGAETSVRVVTAGILPKVAPASDLTLLTGLLADPDAGQATELRFALLGAMRRFVERGDAGPDLLAAAVDRLELEFQRPEADLRRTALELLADETLAPFLAGRDLEPFVAGLAGPTGAELQGPLIALLERHGTAATLESILALGDLSALLDRDVTGEAALARLFGKLAGGDPGLTFAAARALWGADGEDVRVTRRTRALALMAELPKEVVATLDGAAHHRISAWASTLRGLGVDLVASMPGGGDFLQRLVDVHVPSSSGPDVAYGAAEKALMTALFLSDLAAARGNGEAERLEGRVLENFALAEEAAASHTNPDFRLVVLRARARFLARGDDPRALADYAELFDADREGLLETTDLRAAGRLASATNALQAWRYGRALVAYGSWIQEPPAVRLEDLRLLGQWARATGDALVLDDALGLLAELPVEPGAEEPTGDPRAWTGLVGDAASLAKLTGIQDELSAAVDALAAAEAPTSATEQPEPVVPPAPEPVPDEEIEQPVIEPEGGVTGTRG